MSNPNNQRPSYPVTVIKTERVSPHIQRITLQGSNIAHFEKESEGGYIKLLFTPQGSSDLNQLGSEERPVMRTYTIRQFDTQTHSLVVDFVRHSSEDLACSFASRWAETVQVGERISIAGPGKSQDPNWKAAEWVFLAADMTALPALSVTLANLDAETKGYAVIEINDPADQQLLMAPTGVKIIWVNEAQGESLTEVVRAQPWLAGQCAVWCACEFDAMRTLRQYFRNERAIERDFIYISSYWKNGVTEDGHKVIKRQDAEENS